MSEEPNRIDVTGLLEAYGRGERDALDRLLPELYEELRRIARARLGTERANHTLGPTALVHEAYLRLVDVRRVDWRSRVHFFAMASRVMRRVLVDHATRRKAAKRGGGRTRVPLEDGLLVSERDADAVLDLDDGLRRLREESPRVAEALQLRCFGGLDDREIAEALDVSLATVERDLRFGRAWLARDWDGSGPGGS